MFGCTVNTPGRGQSKTLLIVDELGLKIARNSVLIAICHHWATNDNGKLCPNDFYLRLSVVMINVFDCHLPSVVNPEFTRVSV